MKYLGLSLLILLNTFCSSKVEKNTIANELNSTAKTISSDDEFNVSLVRLIANPERYDRKTIQIRGYLNLEFEGNAVYLHKEDYERGLTENGFWVDFSGSIKESKKLDFSKKYVIIVGKFDMKRHGHMGLFGGTIKDISRLDIWSQ